MSLIIEAIQIILTLTWSSMIAEKKFKGVCTNWSHKELFASLI